MNLHDWIDELCDTLELDDVEVDEALLSDLSQTTARQVHPRASAVTAYLLGLAVGQQGARPQQVEALASRVDELAAAWDRPAGGAVEDDDPPADEGGEDYADDHDLGAGDEDDRDDRDDLAGVG